MPSESPLNFAKFIQNLHGRTAYLINKLDNKPGRSVWYQYWDIRLTHQKSHFARLNYVINNQVKHNLVSDPVCYPWCSAAWFERTASLAFVESIKTFNTDAVNIVDDFL